MLWPRGSQRSPHEDCLEMQLGSNRARICTDPREDFDLMLLSASARAAVGLRPRLSEPEWSEEDNDEEYVRVLERRGRHSLDPWASRRGDVFLRLCKRADRWASLAETQ